MTAEDREQTFFHAAFADEVPDLGGKFMQAGVLCANREDGARLTKHGAA
jgi:hypothetical protein